MLHTGRSSPNGPHIWQEFSWPSFILFYAILLTFFCGIAIMNIDANNRPITGLGAKELLH